jgi:type IV secretory pathway TrbF-like protein
MEQPQTEAATGLIGLIFGAIGALFGGGVVWGSHRSKVAVVEEKLAGLEVALQQARREQRSELRELRREWRDDIDRLTQLILTSQQK